MRLALPPRDGRERATADLDENLFYPVKHTRNDTVKGCSDGLKVDRDVLLSAGNITLFRDTRKTRPGRAPADTDVVRNTLNGDAIR